MKRIRINYLALDSESRNHYEATVYGKLCIVIVLIGISTAVIMIASRSSGTLNRSIFLTVGVAWACFASVSWMAEGDRSRRYRRFSVSLAAVASAVMLIISLIHTSNYFRQNTFPEDVIRAESRVRSLSVALESYASSHSGQYPDTLADLDKNDSPADRNYYNLFNCGEFKYLGKGLRRPCSKSILVACEDQGMYSIPGAWACFGDGHVEWLSPQDTKSAR